MQYHRDKELHLTYVGHLIQHPKVRGLADIPHHIHSNRFRHSIHVSYTSYKLAAGWDAQNTARGGLLHDLFYYDWRETKFTVAPDSSPHSREMHERSQISMPGRRYHY